MPNPPFITGFGSAEGDNNKFAWSTRINEGGHQFLLDLMSEYQHPSKSATLRMVVEFAFNWLQHISESQKIELSEILRTRIELNRQLYERRQREADKRMLADLTADIANESKVLLRAKIVKAAREFAEARDLEWPPSGSPTESVEANFIYDKLLEEFGKQFKERIPFRLLMRRTGWNKEDLLTALKILAEDELIRLEGEMRRGPETLWISLCVEETETAF